MPTLNFKPKQITKKILSPLQDRAYEVVSHRFGLNDDAERKTLEAIGETYGITRERVRQIEEAALASIRKSDAFKGEKNSFEELANAISAIGSVVAEDELLAYFSKDESTQNHIHFHLVLGDNFTKHKEDDHFKTRWSVNGPLATKIHDGLKSLYSKLGEDELVIEGEMISRFFDHLKDVSDNYKNAEIAKRWLALSKTLSKNPLGEWGRSDSSNVKTRGVKDYAFLVMRKHGSPMHFREVAKAILDTFGRKTHIATCHNELIKDKRFVLVGRGMYALAEWGYTKGVVRDVIREIIKKNGPLTKNEIIDKVLKERYLKTNTIIVNLHNKKYFKKNKMGAYSVA